MDISVVVPVFNEEEILPELYQRLFAAVSQLSSSFEIIFVNDGSKDNSLQVLKQISSTHEEVKYLSFSRNFGHQLAVSAGLNYSSGKAIVIIDGDLQDPPEVIPELYRKYQEGYKVVYAKRRSREGESFFKKSTAKLFYRILSKITAIDIPIDTGDFRIIDRIVADQLKNMPEHNRFLRGMIAWTGFKQCGVLYNRQERVAGKSGYTIRKMLRFAIDGITSFSNWPLKIATMSGLIVSGIAFIVIIYALYSKFILKDYVAGWTSLIISVMFLGGIQLISIGIIGEYISRINNDVRKRPLYILEETNFTATDQA